LTREICKICHQENPIGFVVPTALWRIVIPKEHWHHVVCISCFTRMADKRLLEWDADIVLYPVSAYSLYGWTH